MVYTKVVYNIAMYWSKNRNLLKGLLCFFFRILTNQAKDASSLLSSDYVYLIFVISIRVTVSGSSTDFTSNHKGSDLILFINYYICIRKCIIRIDFN